MFHLYIDSGTSTSRAYLVKGGKLFDSMKKAVGTKDSSITGSNDLLLAGLRELFDDILSRNDMHETEVESVWMSGMVTSAFGIVEIPHISMPVTAKIMYEKSVRYFEESYFERELRLIRGAKNVSDSEMITLDNIEYVNSVRGEEINIIGLLGSEQKPDGPFVVVAPSSHTQFCYIKNDAFTDVLATFTGELHHALSNDTLLYSERDRGNVEMTGEYVLRGLYYLRKYGFCRALHIVHATKTFKVCSNAERSQMMNGIVVGSVTDLLVQKLKDDWPDAREIIIFGGKNYIEAYRILLEDALPDMPIRLIKDIDGNSFALSGFLELLKYETGEK